MIRWTLFCLAACTTAPETGEPPTRPPADQAIEITGYLDAARISVTSTEPVGDTDVTLLVVGAPGAASNTGGEVMASNLRNDTYDVALPSVDGSFTLELTGRSGDALELTQGTTDAVTLDVASDRAPFPDILHAAAYAPNDHGQVRVELEFADPQHLLFVMATAHGPATHMVSEVDNNTFFTGHLQANTGDWITIHGLDGDRATLAIELEVM